MSGKALTDGRGRIRCIGETGYWRDCGEWAVKWIYTWIHWKNEQGYLPYCPHHIWDLVEGEQ